jgi:replication factor C subunit 2/4
LAHELLGDAYANAVLELNASDDRGIDVVRQKIKMFAQKKVTLPRGRHKIVILDEADNITKAAQQALRRTMELHSDTTRFALACNYSSKIIEPIQSRCAILRFTRLSDEQVLARVMEVIEAENVSYTNEGLQALLFTAQGDMRQALNNLQATIAGFDHLSPENLFKVCDQPHPIIVSTMLVACSQGKSADAYMHLDELWKQGYSADDIIATIFRVAKNVDGLSEARRLAYLKEIGVTHTRIVNGSGSLLQLTGLICRLCLVTS